MVRTRGGLVTSPTPPPRVFTTDKGVKVRKVNGGFRYQPPTLKVISYLALNLEPEDKTPIAKLSKERIEGLIRKIQNQDDNSGIQKLIVECYGIYYYWWQNHSYGWLNTKVIYFRSTLWEIRWYRGWVE